MGEFRLGDHGGYLLSPPGRWSGFWTLDWCGRGGAAPGSQSPLMEEQEGPVWCLNGPRAGLGEISWMGAYLPEVNSAVGFGSMLMRPRLYKGQLVSFCSLYYKPPPISAQTSCKCRKGGGVVMTTGWRLLTDRWLPSCFCRRVTFVATTQCPLEKILSSKAFPIGFSWEASPGDRPSPGDCSPVR